MIVNPWMLPPLAGLALLIGGWSFVLIQHALYKRGERHAEAQVGEAAE